MLNQEHSPSPDPKQSMQAAPQLPPAAGPEIDLSQHKMPSAIPQPNSIPAENVSASTGKVSLPMRVLTHLIENARESKLSLFLLNSMLRISLPFNKPHGIKITQLGEGSIESTLPYRRANYNHLKGLHACAIATAAEFSSGILLLSHLEPARYRIVMESMEVKYHYQGKSDATAKCSIPKQWVEEHIKKPLLNADKVVVPVEANVYDREGRHLATAKINWHVKEWVKTKT